MIEFFEDGNVELYDIRKDAGENRNLAQQLSQKVNILKQQLHAWEKEVGAKMMAPNPEYKRTPETAFKENVLDYDYPFCSFFIPNHSKLFYD